MKKLLVFIATIISLNSCSSQKLVSEINQKQDSSKDREIVFVKLISDSRCPEKTQCIWAGEVTFEVAAYQKGKLIEQKQFTYNVNRENEVVEWFNKHLSQTQEKIKEIAVLPYPKNGVETKQSDYFIKLIY
jgi:hypothetical protein